jgi:hypothetical protein
MTSSVNTFTWKSKPPTAHYVSNVHDNASDKGHSNPENSNRLCKRKHNTTEPHKIFHQAFRINTIEKNKNIQTVSHNNKGGYNILNNNNKTPIKILCNVMFIHRAEVWKPSVIHIPALQIFRTVVRFMSIQTTQSQFLTQRSEMLPTQYIPILTNLSYCFPNQFLIHFFQLQTLRYVYREH